MLSIATIGTFDGVHKGHQFLLDTLCHEAASRGLQPVVVVIDKGTNNRLTTPEEQNGLLKKYTSNIIHFALSDVQHLTAMEFLSTLGSPISTLLMGYNHRFGSDQLDYKQLSAISGKMDVISCPKGPDVSSSAIRQALVNGDIELANSMLGYNYTLAGTVVHGNAIGRTIGFPTANIQVDSCKLIPKPGVYAAKDALVNIGHALNNEHLTIEAYLPNYDGPDFYDSRLSLQLTRRLRDEQHFASLAELKAQIQLDLKRANLL